MEVDRNHSPEEPTDDDDVAVECVRQGVNRIGTPGGADRVRAAAMRDGLPAHELGRGLWSRLLRPVQELQAKYFALAGDGGWGEILTLADRRVVKRFYRPTLADPGWEVSGGNRFRRSHNPSSIIKAYKHWRFMPVVPAV